MEGLKTIVTRIKPGHKLSNNEFVRGRIFGFQEALLRHVDIKTGSRAIAVHEHWAAKRLRRRARKLNSEGGDS